jgi:hypothetical protein
MFERQSQQVPILQHHHSVPAMSDEAVSVSMMRTPGGHHIQSPTTVPPISPIQSPVRSHQLTTNYVVNAVRCFFKSIQLAEGEFNEAIMPNCFNYFSGSRLNDMLRLLTLWFDFGDRPEVYEQLRDSLKLIPPEVWLEVVPQLIARLVRLSKTFF